MKSTLSLHRIHSARAKEPPPSQTVRAQQSSCEQALLRADRLATSLCTAMNRVIIPLSRAAASFVSTSGWAVFGFARLGDYSRERLGRSGRWLRDLAALGQLLQQHHRLASAVTGDDGGRPIGRVAALLIGRSVSPDSYDRWIALSRRMSIRQLRKSLREAAPHGDPAVSDGKNDAVIAGRSHCDHAAADASPAAFDTGCSDECSDRSLARIQVPHAIRIAFDEILDLFRCVEGTDASVTSFIEALVAEGIGPDVPTDVEKIPLARTHGRALVEELLARSTNQWSHLPSHPADQDEAARAGADLLAFKALHLCAGHGDAAALDRQMRQLLHMEDLLSVRLGRLLMDIGERGGWSRLRFAGPGHYAEERLRIGRSRAEDRIRVARALRRFPTLRNAYERGLVGMEATLQIVRLLGHSGADRATEEAWVRHAVATTIKRLRDESRALGRGILLNRQLSESHRQAPGEAPSDPAEIGMHPLPHPLSDADWQRSIHRAVGTARERVLALGLLAAGVRRDAAIPPAGVGSSALPLSPDVFLRLRLPAELCASFLTTIEAARRRLAREVEGDPWTDAATDAMPRPSWIAARTFSIRARRIPSWVGLLAMLEEFADVWDRQHRPARPARDEIYIRDGWRCTAPGCTSRRNLEDHHVIYRSRCGSDALSNRICICRFHHQLGEHGDLAACHGRAPLAITWRLGRAGIGGRYRNERRVEDAA